MTGCMLYSLYCFHFLSILQMTASQTSIFTGEEERFAFIRTVSRLQEMQGDDYWNTDHIPPRQNTIE